MDWFTADWHLGHENIIKFCNRPFNNIGENDRTIIANVNAVVAPDDRLFHLGDVANKTRSENIRSYINQLNCRNLFLIPGNHDKRTLQALKQFFTELPAQYMYERDDYRIVLSHYCMTVWEHSHHGAGHLYGHSHGKLPVVPGAMKFDIGVDSWNYKPLNLAQVKAEMKRLCPLGTTFSGDHHGVKQP